MNSTTTIGLLLLVLCVVHQSKAQQADQSELLAGEYARINNYLAGTVDESADVQHNMEAAKRWLNTLLEHKYTSQPSSYLVVALEQLIGMEAALRQPCTASSAANLEANINTVRHLERPNAKRLVPMVMYHLFKHYNSCWGQYLKRYEQLASMDREVLMVVSLITSSLSTYFFSHHLNALSHGAKALRGRARLADIGYVNTIRVTGRHGEQEAIQLAFRQVAKRELEMAADSLQEYNQEADRVRVLYDKYLVGYCKRFTEHMQDALRPALLDLSIFLKREALLGERVRTRVNKFKPPLGGSPEYRTALAQYKICDVYFVNPKESYKERLIRDFIKNFVKRKEHQLARQRKGLKGLRKVSQLVCMSA